VTNTPYQDQKQSYHGYKVGQRVVLNVSLTQQEGLLDRGTEFTILAFPPCVRPGKREFFVFGKTDTGTNVRASIDEIIKKRS
jgi:hypothetical protein